MSQSDPWQERLLEAMQAVLRPAGFRRRGRVFWADRGVVVHLVDLQADKWNEGSWRRYCVNLGVHSVEVERRLAGRRREEGIGRARAMLEAGKGGGAAGRAAQRLLEEAEAPPGPFSPATAERHLHDRLRPQGGDEWWEVRADADATAAATAIQHLLTTDALPSFDRFATTEALVAYWRARVAGAPARHPIRTYLGALEADPVT